MEIIPINNSNDGEPTVNLRDLWSGLGCKKKFADWKDDRLQGLIEGQDFFPVLGNRSGGTKGRGKKDYDVPLDVAKSIAMMERSEKGQQIRNYFIEAEKKSRSMQPKTLSMSDMCRAYLEQDAKHNIEKARIKDKREATVMVELALLSTDAEMKRIVRESQDNCKGLLNPKKVAQIGEFQSHIYVNKILLAMSFQYILPKDEREVRKKVKGEWVTFTRKFEPTKEGEQFARKWLNNIGPRTLQISLRWNPEIIDHLDAYINDQESV
jgi:phage anti-repressor protein